MDPYPLSLLRRIKDCFHSAISSLLANLFSALFTFVFALGSSPFPSISFLASNRVNLSSLPLDVMLDEEYNSLLLYFQWGLC